MCILQVIKDWAPVISAAGALGTFLAAGAAWRSASNSNKSIRQQETAQKYQKLSSLLDYRYSEKMAGAKRGLRDFYDGFKRAVIEGAARGSLGEYWYHFRMQNPSPSEVVDGYRHYLIVYFTKLYDFHRLRMLKDDDMKAFVNEGEYALLILILRPMEKVIAEDQLAADGGLQTRTGPDPMFAFFDRLRAEGFIG